MNRSIKDKLTSRKLWTMILGVVTGIAMYFGADVGAAGDIASAAVIIVSVASYIIAEGKIDAANVAQTAHAIADIVSAIEGADKSAEFAGSANGTSPENSGD